MKLINPYNSKAVKQAQRRLNLLLEENSETCRRVRRAQWALERATQGSINAAENRGEAGFPKK